MFWWSFVIFFARLAAGEQRGALNPCVCALGGHARLRKLCGAAVAFMGRTRCPFHAVFFAGLLCMGYNPALRVCTSIKVRLYLVHCPGQGHRGKIP